MKAKAPNLLYFACHKSFVPIRLTGSHGAHVETLFSAAHRRVAPAQDYRSMRGNVEKRAIEPSSMNRSPGDNAEKERATIDARRCVSMGKGLTKAEPSRSAIFEPAPNPINLNALTKHSRARAENTYEKLQAIHGSLRAAPKKKTQPGASVAETNRSFWKKLSWKHRHSGSLTVGAGAA